MNRPSDIVRTLRQRNGLTQAEVAKRAGVSQPTVSEVERGIVVPDVDTYAALISAFGLVADFTPKTEVDERLNRLTLVASALSPEDLERLIKLAALLDAVPRPMLDGLILMAETQGLRRETA